MHSEADSSEMLTEEASAYRTIRHNLWELLSGKKGFISLPLESGSTTVCLTFFRSCFVLSFVCLFACLHAFGLCFRIFSTFRVLLHVFAFTYCLHFGSSGLLVTCLQMATSSKVH